MLGKLLLVVSSGFRGHGFATSFFEGTVAVAVSESALAYCRLIDSFAATEGC